MKAKRGLASGRQQRGAAALSVAMVLLFAMTMVAFYANRSLLFEQRTSANQYRATRAFELAEAGIEWATARLNDPQRIDAACAPSSSPADPTFRELMLRHSTAQHGYAPAAELLPACRLTAEGPVQCSCPETVLAPVASDDPGFAVRFAAVPGDAESVEIRSAGCIGRGATCAPGAAGDGSDAHAEVRVVLKLLPTLRHLPRATLTAGGSVALGTAAVAIVNTDAAANGITVNAGRGAPEAAPHAVTLPGAAREASVLQHDAPLAALHDGDPTGDASFRAWFGQSMADYRSSSATTWVCDPTFAAAQGRSCPAEAVGCSGARGCAVAAADAVAAGRNQLWIDADLHFDGSSVPLSLGTSARPVLLVTPSSPTFDTDRPLHGLLFGSGAALRLQGAGTADVHGAVVARGDFAIDSAASLRYDAGALRRLRLATGTLVRVPGSWRDF